MFTPATFRFFEELEQNNCKPWFDEHKPIYQEEVLAPLKALALAMTPGMYAIDPLMDFRPQKMISRIYRDIRFSHDKTPYKKHMWVSFQRPFPQQSVAWESFPGFFIEIGKEGANYGMGLFAPKKLQMDRLREMIAYEPDHFREITEPLITTHGFELGGELYKRPLKNDLPDYFQQWIQRKGVFLIKNHPPQGVITKPEFADYLLKEFTHMQAFYDYLSDVCE